MGGTVCVIGSANMDLVVRAPRLPGPGETVAGGEFQTFPGGKGANQAVAAARMGARVSMVGRVGSDVYGADLRKILGREGVDLTALRTAAGVATGVALITVETGSGENTIVVAGGANRRVSAEDVLGVAGLIRSADVLLVQLEVPVEAVHKAAEVAGDAGRRVVLNAAPAERLPSSLLSILDVLVVNQTEGAVVAGEGAPSEPEALARALLELGPGAAIVTLGAEGAVVAEASGVRRVPSVVVEAVDTVGAGDAFCGALAAMLAEGRSPAEAARVGCVAGALAASAHGAIPSLPTRQAVGARLKER
jgi:ribokinase